MSNSTPAPARVTPTASQSVRVPWGDWLEQLVEHEVPIVEAAASAGVAIALRQVPFGAVVSSFIGPKVIDQYVQMGVAALKGVLSPLGSDVPTTGVVGTVANLILTNEPKFAAWMGDELEPLIKAAVAKLGIAV